MTGPQLRNFEGKLITRSGRLDKRNAYQPANVGRPTTPDFVFDVLHKPNDSRPYHVIGTNLADAHKWRVSRHACKRSAIKRAEQERLNQPDKRPSAKQLHKAGIDQR